MTRPHERSRLRSGIEGLDYILQGGFVQGDVYLVMGPPGSGKTVLGNQLCFNQVNQGHQAIFITLLSENHAHMLQHMQGFSFYDPQAIGNALQYHSGYNVLEREGHDGLLALIRRVIRDYQPSILVMDGLSATMLLGSDLEFKRFVTKVQVHAAMQGCTVFLLTHLHEHLNMRPEMTIVDGILRITNTIVNHTPIREIQIQKMRGMNHIRGEHFFTIIDDGIKIYPRLEAQFIEHDLTEQAKVTPAERYQFGIPNFDTMLNGGIQCHSTTLMLGPTGSGKTILGLHFLGEGLKQDQPGLYFGFSETINEILYKAQATNINLEYEQETPKLHILWNSTFEQILDELAEQLLTAVRTHNIKRLFIDGLQDLQAIVIYEKRFPRFLKALATHLQKLNVTTLVALETAGLLNGNINLDHTTVSSLGFGENIILLRHVEQQAQLYRLISIIKMRHSAFDARVHMFTITDQGIQVESSSASAEQLYSDRT